MKLFKITFPSGYQVEDFYNDNIDINVALINNKVFFATAFTLVNIKNQIERDKDIYFWCKDMFMIKDLRKSTIREAITKILDDEYFELIFSEIGTIEKVYKEGSTFDNLIDMTL